MPTFDDVEVVTSISVDFEVFCGTCGVGMCNESDTRSSRGRGYAQVTVNACDNCIEAAREEIRSDLEDQIQVLQDRVSELEDDLEKVDND